MHLKNNLKRVLACAGSSLPHTRLLQVWGAGPTLVAVRGLLTAGASLAAAQAPGAQAQYLQHAGSAVAVLGLSCLKECGIFPDPSFPLNHQGSPSFVFYFISIALGD